MSTLGTITRVPSSILVILHIAEGGLNRVGVTSYSFSSLVLTFVQSGRAAAQLERLACHTCARGKVSVLRAACFFLQSKVFLLTDAGLCVHIQLVLGFKKKKEKDQLICQRLDCTVQ